MFDKTPAKAKLFWKGDVILVLRTNNLEDNFFQNLNRNFILG